MTMLEKLRQQRDAMRARLTELRNLTEFSDTELTEVDTLVRDLPTLDERVRSLEETERREALAATARVETGQTDQTARTSGQATQSTSVSEPDLYRRGGQHSYFRDLARSQVFGQRDATDRLVAYRQAHPVQERALGNTNATGGSGGEFAPPEWMVGEFVNLARAGRVTADLFQHADVPVGVSSVNLPKILTGTSVALQSTENTALSNTDLTTGSVGTGFSTVGGRQIVSQQLLDQSEIDFDQVILGDLAAAYATQLGGQVFTGTGTGANNNSVINGLGAATVPAGNQITYTAASPTAAGFYSKAAGALSAFMTARFVPPTCWVMHPRRWYWLLAQVDANNRPLVVPIAQTSMPNVEATNAMGATMPNVMAQGAVGLFLGLPVFIDPNVPTNLGAGTNEDRVYLLKQDDLWLFESAPRAEVFRETYADSLGVLFRLYSYVGTILNRFPASIAYIGGTGLVAPTF